MPPTNQSHVIFGGGNICRASMRAIRKHLQRPMTSASGLSCFIMLHEPHVYFSRPSQINDVSEGHDSKAVIRGTLRLVVTEIECGIGTQTRVMERLPTQWVGRVVGKLSVWGTQIWVPYPN